MSNKEMMIPKPIQRKKKMRHKASILDTEKGICYICDKLYGDRSYKYTEYHHIMYGGGKRKDSERLGLTVYLCREHHKDGPAAVHNFRDTREYLCREAQKEYEKSRTREEWMGLGFKNYLEREEKKLENAVNTKCEGNFKETQEQEEQTGAAGIEIGEYVGYIWNGELEFGYILDYGPEGTVWIGEESDAWVRRLVEIPNVLR